MTFLAGGMLVGLAAVGIPLLIHLFKRRSAKRVDWGAMEFLLGSVVRRSRLMMIEELVLLAVRCVLVVAVVLTMARPLVPVGGRALWMVVFPLLGGAGAALAAGTVLWSRPRARWSLFGAGGALLAAGLLVSLAERGRQLGRWAGGAQNDIAVILDASGSMHLRRDGRSSFDSAVAEARALIDALPAGNGVSLILGGPVPEVLTPAPLSDRRRLHALLDDVEPGEGVLAVADSLHAAAAALVEGTRPHKKIVLFTDTQSVGWDAEAGSGWQAVARALHDLVPGRRDKGAEAPAGRAPVPVLCRMLPMKDNYRNVAIAGIRLTRRAIGPDRPVGIEVTVVNTGTTTVEPFPVRLEIDGEPRPLALSAGPLSAGMSETVAFLHRFGKAAGAGPIRGVVARADLADDLPGDNVSAAVAAFSPRLPVLVVDGNPGAALPERAAGFLEIALAPYGPTNAPPSAPAQPGAAAAAPPREPFIAPQVVEASGFGAMPDFASNRVVVLADVPRLTAAAADRLAAYVEQGGSLLVALGSRCLPEFYNGWTAADGEPVAGARLRAFAVRGPKEAPAGIRVAELNHPGLAVVADEKQSDLGEAAVRAYWRLDPPAESGPARAWGRFDTGDPVLVERRLGRGRVIALAFPLDAVSGNLPALRAFLPLAHSLVYELAAAPEAERLQVRAGGHLRLGLPGGDRGGPPEAGLRGDYFAGRDFDSFVATRVDGAVNFAWNDRPAGDVPPDDFAVRWTGSLRPRFDDRYTFYVSGDDRARLWIDDQPVAASVGAEQSGSVQLATNRVYDIRVELVEVSGGASVRLEWSSPNQVREVVPQACLQASRPVAARVKGGGDALLTGSNRVEYAGTLEYEQAAPVVAVEAPLAPGLYRLKVPASVADRCAAMADAQGRLPVAVAADAEEGRFVPLAPEAFDAIGRHVEFVRVETVGQLTDALGGNVPGREITSRVAAAVILILLLETAMTRWISGMRRSGETAASAGAREAAA